MIGLNEVEGAIVPVAHTLVIVSKKLALAVNPVGVKAVRRMPIGDAVTSNILLVAMLNVLVRELKVR